MRVYQKHKLSLSRKDKEKRRLKAAKMFKNGISQAEIAEKLRVTPAAVSQWHKLWDKSGSEALKSIGCPGPESDLIPEKRKAFKKAIRKLSRTIPNYDKKVKLLADFKKPFP